METREEIVKLAQIKNQSQSVDPEETREELVEVSEATKRIAYAYERFRNTLEPDERDILRRHAITRILQRRLPEGRPAAVTAEQLLQELIRGHYVRAATRGFAEQLAHRVNHIEYLYNVLPEKTRQWFLEVAAVSIDRDIFPRRQEEKLVQLMYEDTWPRLVWADDLVVEKNRHVQTYITCHRSLFEADDMEITWHYWRRHWPSWDDQVLTPAQLDEIASGISEFYYKMQESLHHPARERLNRLLRPVAAPYRVLRDLVKEDLPDQDEALDAAVRSTIEKRSGRTKQRMAKRAWNSILFLFLTKTILTGILEVPYELVFKEEVHLTALIANIVFHPVLLFLTATTVKWPGSKNTEAIVEQIRFIVSEPAGLPTVVLRKSRNYGPVVWTVFALIYVVLFMVIFWGMFLLLTALEFSLVAMFMFVVFLGLVTFLAARIRRSVNDLRLLPGRDGAIGTLVTFVSLPILEFGRWLALKVQQLNIPLIFMDRVLEAPFKILIDLTEEWFSFVRERKEEIV